MRRLSIGRYALGAVVMFLGALIVLAFASPRLRALLLHERVMEEMYDGGHAIRAFYWRNWLTGSFVRRDEDRSWYVESGFRSDDGERLADGTERATRYNFDGTVQLQWIIDKDGRIQEEKYEPPWWWGAEDQTEPTAPWWKK